MSKHENPIKNDRKNSVKTVELPVGKYEPEPPNGRLTRPFIEANTIYFVIPNHEGKEAGDIYHVRLVQSLGSSHAIGEQEISDTLIDKVVVVKAGEENEDVRVLLPKEKLLLPIAICHMDVEWSYKKTVKSTPPIIVDTRGA